MQFSHFVYILSLQIKLHVKILLNVFSVSYHFSFSFCPLLVSIAFLFSQSPTTVYCLSTSNKSGDVLSVYSLLPTILVFVVSVVTVASVAIVKGSDSSLSLPEYTVIFL